MLTNDDWPAADWRFLKLKLIWNDQNDIRIRTPQAALTSMMVM